jgi:CBS domain-containing protein
MKTLFVEEIFRPHCSCALSVEENTEIEETIAKFAENPAIRGIYLLDLEQRFLGIIRLTDLRNWVKYRILKEYGTYRALSAWDAYHLISAQKCSDLLYGDRSSLGIKKDDSLQTALDKMVEHQTNILPVIDDDDMIIGDLLLSDILFKVVESGKQGNK